jgi:hypothetical protein
MLSYGVEQSSNLMEISLKFRNEKGLENKNFIRFRSRTMDPVFNPKMSARLISYCLLIWGDKDLDFLP